MKGKNSQKTFFSEALAAGGSTLLSRILGFVRDILIVQSLGLGADIFLAAFRIPNLARRLSAEGSLGLSHAVALGHFHANKQAFPSQSSYNYTLQVFCLFFLMGAFLALILGILAGLAVWFIAPGFTKDPETLNNFILYFRLCLPYLPLAAGGAILSTSLVAYGRAGFASLSPALLNVGIIFMIILAIAYQTNLPDPSQSSDQLAIFICLGVLLGGLMQFTWLLRGFLSRQPQKSSQRQTLFKLVVFLKNYFIKRELSPRIKKPLRKLPYTLVASSTSQLHFFASLIPASFLVQGSISSLYLAERMVEFPLALTGVVLATVAMPDYARLSAQDKSLKNSLTQSLSLCLFLSVPACAGLSALASPISQVLFAHGYYSLAQAKHTASIISITALSLPPLAMGRLLVGALVALDSDKNFKNKAMPQNLGTQNRARHSQNLSKKCSQISLVSALIIIFLSFIFIPFMELKGIALSLVLGAFFSFFCLYRLSSKNGLDIENLNFIKKSSLVLFLGLLLYFLLKGLSLYLISALARGQMALSLIGLIPSCIVLWFSFFYLIRQPEAVKVINFFKSKMRK